MAINTFWGVMYKNLFMDGLEPEAFEYIAVVVPVVVVFGPLGGLLSSFVHREVYSVVIYILDTVQFITALIIVHLSTALWIFTFACAILSSVFFMILSFAGEWLLNKELSAIELSTIEQPSTANKERMLMDSTEEDLEELEL
jgi:hypothetical protein